MHTGTFFYPQRADPSSKTFNIIIYTNHDGQGDLTAKRRVATQAKSRVKRRKPLKQQINSTKKRDRPNRQKEVRGKENVGLFHPRYTKSKLDKKENEGDNGNRGMKL